MLDKTDIQEVVVVVKAEEEEEEEEDLGPRHSGERFLMAKLESTPFLIKEPYCRGNFIILP